MGMFDGLATQIMIAVIVLMLMSFGVGALIAYLMS